MKTLTLRTKIFRSMAFLLIAISLFSLTSYVLERKTLTGAWNYMGKMNEFYDLPRDTMDYICVGSSHAYCSINPLEVWKNNGIKGFVLATQQQPLRASYHYIKEAFKTQSPKIVFLEAYMVFADSHTEGVLYDAIDPLKPSWNKIEMIQDLVPEANQREAYYFNILKYHARWKDVDANEIYNVFFSPKDYYKGFVALNTCVQAVNQIPNYDMVEATPIPAENLSTLNDILNLVEKNDAELVIMLAPYDTGRFSGTMKSVYNWSRDNSVRVLDYTVLLDALEIDPHTDYVDSSHLNVYGAAKLSKHLAGYLTTIGLPANPKDTAWEADYVRYKTKHLS